MELQQNLKTPTFVVFLTPRDVERFNVVDQMQSDHNQDVEEQEHIKLQATSHILLVVETIGRRRLNSSYPVENINKI